MKWFFLTLALAAAMLQASDASAHFVHRAPRQVVRVERVFVQPQAVLLAPTYVQPQAVFAPSVTYDPPVVQSQYYEQRSFSVPATALYSTYQSACQNEGVAALPLEVFSVRSREFRGSARDFNLRVGPLGRVRIN